MTGVHNDIDDRITTVLSRYLPERRARAIVVQARRSTGTDGRVPQTDTSAFFGAIEQHTARLLDRKARAQLRGDLEFELATSISGIVPTAIHSDTIDVRSEWDVSFARARARELMTGYGAKSYDTVKVMTVVSELARNIVLYTPRGKMAFTLSDSPRMFVVRAVDEGPGIPNLEEVLSGNYRSKTGLGQGLVGVKRLATRFSVLTDATGTQVEVQVRF